MFIEHKEQGEVTEAPAKITKLSDAIRMGCLMRPQGWCEPFKDGGSCVIGAAYEGLGGKVSKDIADDTYNAWVFVTDRLGLHNDGEVNCRLMEALYEQNDYGATREQIADWLENQGL